MNKARAQLTKWFITSSSRTIIIIIKIFVYCHRFVTSEALGPGNVLVTSRSMRESLREEVSL